MAVYTEVSFTAANDLLQSLRLGQLQSMQACPGGIENTNYFVTTTQGAFVLTLFERLSFAELPFYLQLMHHLSTKGIPTPNPAPDAVGSFVHTVLQKPASVVTKLQGTSALAPNEHHCQALGSMLAKMHLAAQDFEFHQSNLRGLSWMNRTMSEIAPHIPDELRGILHAELAHHNQLEQDTRLLALPEGPIHADLFRDNVLFDSVGGQSPHISGVFDFYFAGCDKWLFDVAVCVNDWCIDLSTGIVDAACCASFLKAYHATRPFTAEEIQLFSDMTRRAALRFWISRLWDFYLPRAAHTLKAHDPTHFEKILQSRIQQPLQLSAFGL